jgi:uncharacterized Zn-binding protein involved in type VI secretion
MPGICRDNLDTVAGGLLQSSGQSFVFINGRRAIVVGDRVVGGNSPCENARMIQGSSRVLINGIPVCRVGDLADCGSPAQTGSPNVMAGS